MDERAYYEDIGFFWSIAKSLIKIKNVEWRTRLIQLEISRSWKINENDEVITKNIRCWKRRTKSQVLTIITKTTILKQRSLRNE